MDQATAVDMLHAGAYDDMVRLVDLRATGTVLAELSPVDARLLADRLYSAAGMADAQRRANHQGVR